MKKILSFLLVLVSLTSLAQEGHIQSYPRYPGKVQDSLLYLEVEKGTRSFKMPVTLLRDSFGVSTATQTAKLDSIKVSTDTLNQYVGATPKFVTKLAKYSLVNPNNGDYLKYDSLNKQFINFKPSTASTQRFDSIQTGSSDASASGNAYVNTNDNRIHYKSGSYWYRLTVLDSTFAPVLTALNFSTFTTGFTNNAGVWSGAVGGTYGNYALADKKLAAGNDGYIEEQYVATDGESAIIAFSNANTNKNYTAPYQAGAYIFSGQVYTLDGSATGVNSNVSITLGSYLRLIRTGTVYKAQKSADHVTWTDIKTFTYATNTVDIFINVNTNATNKLYYPKGYGLQ